VYACEWNPHAITALRHNLLINGVENQCIVIEGDNRLTAPQATAGLFVCLLICSLALSHLLLLRRANWFSECLVDCSLICSSRDMIFFLSGQFMGLLEAGCCRQSVLGTSSNK
jgi:hypothetical protein